MTLSSPSSSRQWRGPVLVGLLVGVLGVFGFLAGAFQSASRQATDRLFLPRPADGRIVIVTIDDASIAQLGRWPWARNVHADLISKLHAAGAVVIAYDVNFSEPSDTEQDAALGAAVRRAGNVVLPIELTLVEKKGMLTYDPAKVLSPMADLAGAARATGFTNMPPDADGVVRRIPIFASSPTGSGAVPSFALAVREAIDPGRDVRMFPQDGLHRTMVSFTGAPGQSYPMFSAVDVVRGRIPEDAFRGRVVFVGATAPDLHDDRLVPTSYGMPMSGVEIHASFFETMLAERWLVPVPVWIHVLLLLAIGVFLGFLIPQVRARYSLLAGILILAALLSASFSLFDRGRILDILWPTLVLLFAYASITLERRIVADRERREVRMAFSRYVSPPVVSAILKDVSKLKLGGERRRMSVLFSDVRGFTSLSEKMTPEELVEVMNTYLTQMTDVVFSHDGVLDKYIGDAVMAFWNAPLDQPDHALRAVRTALQMQAALAKMNADGVFPDGITLQIGVGVNTGDMIVGNMGSDRRFDYTVIGDSVNLASRLEGITKEYGVGVIVTDATRQELGEEILVRRLDKVAVKGKREPVMIYEAIAPRATATEQDRGRVDFYEAALTSYFQGRFEETISRCATMEARFPDDASMKRLRAHAEAFLRQPPPEDWDGTWVMKTK